MCVQLPALYATNERITSDGACMTSSTGARTQLCTSRRHTQAHSGGLIKMLLSSHVLPEDQLPIRSTLARRVLAFGRACVDVHAF